MSRLNNVSWISAAMNAKRRDFRLRGKQDRSTDLILQLPDSSAQILPKGEHLEAPSWRQNASAHDAVHASAAGGHLSGLPGAAHVRAHRAV